MKTFAIILVVIGFCFLLWLISSFFDKNPSCAQNSNANPKTTPPNLLNLEIDQLNKTIERLSKEIESLKAQKENLISDAEAQKQTLYNEIQQLKNSAVYYRQAVYKSGMK